MPGFGVFGCQGFKKVNVSVVLGSAVSYYQLFLYAYALLEWLQARYNCHLRRLLHLGKFFQEDHFYFVSCVRPIELLIHTVCVYDPVQKETMIRIIGIDYLHVAFVSTIQILNHTPSLILYLYFTSSMMQKTFEGTVWQHMRKHMACCFTPKQIVYMIPMMYKFHNDEPRLMCNNLLILINGGSSRSEAYCSSVDSVQPLNFVLKW
jgi:hypothetical protein